MIGVGAQALSEIHGLAGLPDAALEKLAQTVRTQTYRSGEKLAERGQDADHVCFVISGHLRVLNYSSAGRMVRYAALATGDFFWRACGHRRTTQISNRGCRKRLCNRNPVC